MPRLIIAKGPDVSSSLVPSHAATESSPLFAPEMFWIESFSCLLRISHRMNIQTIVVIVDYLQ